MWRLIPTGSKQSLTNIQIREKLHERPEFEITRSAAKGVPLVVKNQRLCRDLCNPNEKRAVNISDRKTLKSRMASRQKTFAPSPVRCHAVVRMLCVLFGIALSNYCGLLWAVVDFESEVKPLLEERCFKCHSHHAEKLKANLFLDSLSGMLQGGDSGPAIVPGNLEKSRLVEAIRYRNIDLQMPPKSKLSVDEIAVLENWVKDGAPWPKDSSTSTGEVKKGFDLQQRRAEHWAWQPVAKVEPPRVKDPHWASGPVDQFVLSKLEAAGITPAL